MYWLLCSNVFTSHQYWVVDHWIHISFHIDVLMQSRPACSLGMTRLSQNNAYLFHCVSWPRLAGRVHVRLQRCNLAWLHCAAAVRPCCCAPCLTRAYVKNVGRHPLHWKVCVCVCSPGYLARPTVTSHTTAIVLLSSFTAHCVLCTGRSVKLWAATMEISKFGGSNYPSESLANSRSVSWKNPFPVATQSVFSSVIYPSEDQAQKL